MAEETILDKKKVVDLFRDPIRFKIFTELFFTPEKTAKEILDVLPINRSTLSHHLTKMVDENVLKVRINPTGRAIKYYSLAVPFHKIEVRSKMNISSEKEKRDALMLLVQQIGFELRMANTMFETYQESLLAESDVARISFSDSQIQYTANDTRHNLMNGGIFFTTKEHGARFIAEMETVISKFRREVFEINSQDSLDVSDFAVVFAGFNLNKPVKIKAKRVIVADDKNEEKSSSK